MRILIFTEVFSPYVCGISSYIEVLKKGLEALSHKVLIVTSDPNVSEDCYKDGVIRCPAKPARNKYGYECKKISNPKVLNFICRFRPDVVHIHTDTKIAYMGLEVADRVQAPVVFTIHDYFLDRHASDNPLLWRMRTYFEKKHFCDLLDTADTVTSSCSRADLFVKRAGRKVPVQLVQTAVDTEHFDDRRVASSAVEKLRFRLGLSSNAVTAVFAGSLSVEKNLEFALAAFARYIKPSDNIQLLIVGDGTETDYLKNLCRKLNITDRVWFAGTVPHEHMPVVYAASDVYVCSYDDGLMSVSFVEAMACGLPVLIKEDRERIAYKIVQNGVNGLVYQTPEEFAEYLKKIASLDTAQKQRIRDIVRRTVPNDAYTSMARDYLEIYRQLPKKD